MKVDLVRAQQLAQIFGPFYGPFSYWDRGQRLMAVDTKLQSVTPIADIRSWGYLTGHGHGAHALNPNDAINIQNALGEYLSLFSPEKELKC